jgi:hypothetical protein
MLMATDTSGFSSMPLSQHALAPARTRISEEALFASLTRGFEAGRAFECASGCVMPHPTFREVRDGQFCNWFVVLPRGCPRFCHLVMAAVIARNSEQYDLELLAHEIPHPR